MTLNPLPLLFDIRLGARGIEFIFLRMIVIATIRYENISLFSHKRNLIAPLTAYRFVNRFGRRYVIHQRSSWFSKSIVISPSDGDAFEQRPRNENVKGEA